MRFVGGGKRRVALGAAVLAVSGLAFAANAAGSDPSFYWRLKPGVIAPQGSEGPEEQAVSISLQDPASFRLTTNEPVDLELTLDGNADGVTYRAASAARMQGLSVNPATGAVSGTPNGSPDEGYSIAVEAVRGGRVVTTSNSVERTLRAPFSVVSVPDDMALNLGADFPLTGLGLQASGGDLSNVSWSLANAPAWLGVVAGAEPGHATLRLNDGAAITETAPRVVTIVAKDAENREAAARTFQVSVQIDLGAPTNLAFAPLTGQVHGDLVLSEALPVTGLSGTKFLVLGDQSGAFQYRVCLNAECSQIRSDWSQGNWEVSNGNYVQVRAGVPMGNLEKVSTVFSISPQVVGGWSVTAGPRSDVVAASGTMPMSATFAGAAYPVWRLYNGAEALGPNMGGSDFVYDFGQLVSFNSFHLMRAYSGDSYDPLIMSVETPNGWVKVGSTRSAGVVSLGKTVTAQRVKVSSYDNFLYELRIGDGDGLGAHAAPVLNYADMGVVARLSTEPQAVPLSVTANVDRYGDPAPLSFDVVAGQLPAGASVDGSGVLHLPAGDPAVEGSWTFTVKVTDRYGFSSQKQIKVAKAVRTAAEVYPVTFDVQGQNFTAVAGYYDNNPASAASVVNGQTYVYNFAEEVAVDRVKLYLTKAVKMKLEGMVDGNWVVLYDSGETSWPGGQYAEVEFAPAVVTKMRFTNRGSVTTMVGDFYCGYGVYPPDRQWP